MINTFVQKLKTLIHRVIALSVRLVHHRAVHWGNLRRLAPVSRVFGFDRGGPIDRYYIEKFLQYHKKDIAGYVLEIGDAEYTRRFGEQRVTRSEVLHAVSGNPQATLVGDLSTGAGIPRDYFDCIILVQTLHVIYNAKSAVEHCFKALKPGGVLLATFPGISQISRYDMDRWGDYWRFTDASARKLFEGSFGPGNVEIETFGNVLVACAFLLGLGKGELTTRELDHRDPDYQALIAVRAEKKK